MQFWKLVSLTILPTLVIGCGGGGGNSAGFAATIATSTGPFAFVAPTLNTQHTYAKTTLDNSNNTINQSFIDTVTAVNQDGSFVSVRDDPSHNSVIVDGTTYSIATTTFNINNSGQETSYSYTPTNGSLTTCTYTPHGAGPNYPFSVGDTWSSSWNFACGSNTPVNTTQTGLVADVESITVPAGTFTTVKLKSTLSATDLNGTMRTDSRTTWRDVNGSHTKIMEQDIYTISGTIPTNGYPVSEVVILQN